MMSLTTLDLGMALQQRRADLHRVPASGRTRRCADCVAPVVYQAVTFAFCTPGSPAVTAALETRLGVAILSPSRGLMSTSLCRSGFPIPTFGHCSRRD